MPFADLPPAVRAHATLQALRSADLGILITESDACRPQERYVYVNGAAAHLLDTPVESILGRSVEPSLLGDAHFTPEEPTSRACYGVVREQHGELTRRDGQRVAIRWLSVRTATGNNHHVVHFLIRADRRSRAEQALAHSEQRFRRLIDAAPDGMLVLAGGRITYANQAIARLAGYSHPRQLAHLALSDLFLADHHASLERLLNEALKHGYSSSPHEIRAIHREGHSVPIEVDFVPTEWDTERAVLLLVRDLSDRRELQNQWVRTDRLAAVGTLAAGVAHEINNPLAYVLLNIQYLLREVRKLTPNTERVGHLLERLQEARHGAERVASIVRDLRTFSRAEEEEIGPIDLRRVLDSAVKVARSQLMERGTITEQIEDVPLAMGNASRLEQVFLNLLVNAIQALPETGGVANRIHVHVGRRGAGSEDERILVSVADTGAGIRSEHLGRVFDPFFTTKPVGLGTGLGLPICHSIITRMGGTIEVESQVGEGTRFVVALQLARERLRPAPRISTPVALSLTRRTRVLVVDDELPVASILSRVLCDEHDVEIATSAESALEMISTRSFDVVICDLLMPRMSGMDLHEEISQRFPGQEDRLVFMTGGAFTPRAAQFLARVSNPRIEKPFDLGAVRKLVREWKLQGPEIP